MIKSRRKRWAGHVERIGKRRGIYRVLVGKSERKGYSKKLGLCGIMLNWIFSK
jgi:hypothetical protein